MLLCDQAPASRGPSDVHHSIWSKINQRRNFGCSLALGGAVMGCMSSILSWKVCSECLHWVYTPGLMKLSWTVLKGCLSKETCRPVWGVSSGRLLLGIFLGFKCWNEVVSLGLRVVFVTVAHEEPKGWTLARHPSHLEPNYEWRHNGLIYILSFSLITIHGKHLHYLRGVELSIPLFESTLVYWQIDSYIYIYNNYMHRYVSTYI